MSFLYSLEILAQCSNAVKCKENGATSLHFTEALETWKCLAQGHLALVVKSVETQPLSLQIAAIGFLVGQYF